MNRLTDKVAIVTGASKGIGAAAAKALAADAAAVAVNYSSAQQGAERVVSQITSEGSKAIAIQADVSKAADVKRMFAETKKALGSINMLVNNAGVFQFEPFEAITEKEFHREFEHQCTRDDSRHTGSVEVFSVDWRQHHQYQLDHRRQPGAEFGALLRHEGGD
jgi:NAD(P)-dependent dehydrogenase (short-subunit alcohol dehydrogenase family)